MIATRYAKALSQLIPDGGDELNQILEVVSRPPIAAFFASPQITLEAKKGAIRKMFERRRSIRNFSPFCSF